MLARPLFRERHHPDMSEEEATQLLHEGLRVSLCDQQLAVTARSSVRSIYGNLDITFWWHLQVCYYRDKQTTNKFQIAQVTAQGVNISEPFALDTKWDYKVSLVEMCWDLHSVCLRYCSRECGIGVLQDANADLFLCFNCRMPQAFVNPGALAVGTW